MLQTLRQEEPVVPRRGSGAEAERGLSSPGTLPTAQSDEHDEKSFELGSSGSLPAAAAAAAAGASVATQSGGLIGGGGGGGKSATSLASTGSEVSDAARPHTMPLTARSSSAGGGGRLEPALAIQRSLDMYLRTESQLKDGLKKTVPASATVGAQDRARLPSISPLDASRDVADDPARNVFLFVNPSSGGNAASVFMVAGVEYVRLSCGPDDNPVNLWIWDIRQGTAGAKPGFVKLRQVVQNLAARKAEGGAPPACGDIVYLIVCGGDGTVMWAVTELWAHDIPDEHVALGVVPYGTGNDFARALGWQSYNAARPYDNNFAVLQKLVSDWLSAAVVFHDIWEVTLRVFPSGGRFMKIDSETREKKVIAGIVKHDSALSVVDAAAMAGEDLDDADDVGAAAAAASVATATATARVLTLKMCNYFSLGIESRIGVGFDRHRTTSQVKNKVRYAVEGLKKAWFRNIPPLTDTVDRLVSKVPSPHGLVAGGGKEIVHFRNGPTGPAGKRATGGRSGSCASCAAGAVAATRRSSSIGPKNASATGGNATGGSATGGSATGGGATGSSATGAPDLNRQSDSKTLGDANCKGGRNDSSGNATSVTAAAGTAAAAAAAGFGPAGGVGVRSFSVNSPPRVAPALGKDTRSLIVSNLPSFAAGLDIWRPARKSGLTAAAAGGKLLPISPDEAAHKQAIGDGCLEFVAFSGATALGLERAFHGQGRRVAHGPGPFVLHFKEPPRDQQREQPMYFQIDGEFFVMIKPQRVTIEFKRRIKVLASAAVAKRFPDRFCSVKQSARSPTAISTTLSQASGGGD